MQYNYGLCDKPVCEYCDLVRNATAGAVEPPVAATQKDLKAAVDDLENKLQTASLQLEGQRADGDYDLGKGLGTRIDAAVSGLVHGVSVDGIAKDKKATDTDGVVYIVDPAPTGTFAGHANQVASLQSGVWHFQAPSAQETHLNEADNQMYTWNGTAWVKVGSVGNAEKVNEAIHKATDKPVPHDNDEFGITDSEDTARPYNLRKLTWANLQTGIWLGVKKAMDKGQDIGSGNPADADYNLPLVGTRFGDVWGWNIGDFKKHLFNVGAVASGTLHDDSTFQIRTPAGVVWKAPWHWIKENVGTWLAGSTANGTVGDTDTFLTFMAADGGLRKTTGAQLKAYVAASGGPSYKYINRNDVAFDGGVFIINDITTTTPAFIEVKGMATAVGSANAEAVLIMATGGGYRTDLDTVFSNAKRTGTWGSGGSQNDGGFNDGHFYLNMNAGNASTQLKGNCVATWQLRLYKQSNGWVMIEWQGLYEGGSDTQIFCAGNASALLTGNVTHFGIGFVDAASTHGNRNIFADLVLEVHP